MGSSSSPLQNEFDNLLDIFSSDMDFEQAFSMYSNLQQKKALGTLEELSKVQMLNQQYTTNLPPQDQSQQQQQQQQQQYAQQYAQESHLHHENHYQDDTFAHSRQQILNGSINYNQQQQQQQQQQEEDIVEEGVDEFDQFFTNTESDALERFLDNLANPSGTGDPLQFYNPHITSPNGFHKDLDLDFNFEMHTMKVPSYLRSKNSPDVTSSTHTLIQQHQQHPSFQQQHQQQRQQQQQHPSHSSTYHDTHEQQQQHQISQLQNHYLPTQQQSNDKHMTTIHMQALPSPPMIEYHINNQSLKRELTEAFAPETLNTQPCLQTKPKSQLVTPPTSGDESKKRQSDEEQEDDESDDENPTLVKTRSSSSSCCLLNSSSSSSSITTIEEPQKKKRRSSNKPLLSLEQKRLNHSYSEQKRRQLCKLAYQRCLEQIIDLEAFNMLPECNEAERKSKRARVNKEGLPNLSKHNALIRISNEMQLIIGLNDQLKKLLNG
ncbi:hypothetical protein KGF56_002754 [Candida oxycetoniae]|uniref:BHLH domain-containing protein n=1 Tax=Candida oxycetoniae TaxID=497107 RepID=A0AAI9SWW3_9ASCO|nr:uncharacterized protein KGF56_002754 [Candida oxycetoniae]KAI3404457.2 hypothetical protein KGF56_002754 [Candida oxycetoniae]